MAHLGEIPKVGGSAKRLLDHRKEIAETWERRLRAEISSAKREKLPVIINTLPLFLEELAKALSPDDPKKYASQGNFLPVEHGRERARLTSFSIEQVMREYGILRAIIFEKLDNEPRLSVEESRIINDTIDRAMAEATAGYHSVQAGIRETFTVNLTHDLKGPLTAAKTCAQLILRHPTRQEKVLVLASRIVDSMNRTERMIQDLLDASRVRAGEKLSMKMDKCELEGLALEVIYELATIHGDRFVLKSDAPIEGYWNREMLQRAIHNLLTNAIKYGRAGDPVSVTIRDFKDVEHVSIAIHNHGKGISSEDQRTLFEPYRRTQDAQSGSQPGWGLGLAIVRGVAEAHGGAVVVESTPEKGTTFVIDLPIDSRPFGSKDDQNASS